MVPYAKEHAEILPADFEENLDKLFQNLFVNSERAVQTLEDMITKLEEAVKSQQKNNYKSGI